MFFRISNHNGMVLRIKSDFVGATLSAGRTRRDGFYIVKRRLGICEIKHLHRPVGIVGPEMIVRSAHDPAGSHSFEWPARVPRRTDAVETWNPSQEQIIFCVEDVHSRISAFRK